jgi:hypothetical protein
LTTTNGYHTIDSGYTCLNRFINRLTGNNTWRF